MKGYLPHRCCYCMQGFKVGDLFYNDGFTIYHFTCLIKRDKKRGEVANDSH